MELKWSCWINHCCSCRNSFPSWTFALQFSSLKHLPLSLSWRDWGSPWRWCQRRTRGHCRWSGRWDRNGVSARSHRETNSTGVGTAGCEYHLCKSFHIVADDLRVGTLQLADDFKALIELGEHVDHGAGEQSVLRRDLELESQKKRQDWGVGDGQVGMMRIKVLGADAAAALLSNIKREVFDSHATSTHGAAPRCRRCEWLLLGWEPRRLVMAEEQEPSLTDCPLVSKVLECDCCFADTGEQKAPLATIIGPRGLLTYESGASTAAAHRPSLPCASSHSLFSCEWEPGACERHSALHFFPSAIEWLLIALRPLSCPSVS